MIAVRPLGPGDREWKQASLTEAWGSTVVARGGETVDAMPLDGFVAEEAGRRVGLLTYGVAGDEVEVVTIHVETEGRGAGRALMDAVRAVAVSHGARRLWLSTTNDNIRAISFYQRWGMDLAELRHGAVAASRAVKPSIPMAAHGIPIRHELILERRLR